MDYTSLGFKAGLEIHQQLEGKKLFCNCPTVIKKDKSDYNFRRVLRASAGESGAVDKAALHELKKSKEFEYHGYDDVTCLVEMDEEPPHNVNNDALTIALKVGKLLNMKIPDSIQFMRKTVIDGSNTSGFQRTALVGKDGFITVKGKRIGVESLCLEEEACQVIKRGKDKDVYNLSRLGIPLLEIATAPDITSPEECKEVASHIGMLLRSVGGMKRGIGTIRQDVNVSIKKGARTEIKGFQDHKNIPKVIENEVKRQLDLINKNKKVETSVRKAEPDFTASYLRPMPGADRMYPETDVDVIIPEKVDFDIPETLEEKENRIVKEYKISNDLAKNLVKYESKTGDSVEGLIKKYSNKNLNATTIVDTYLILIPSIEKKHGKIKTDVKDLFEEVKKGKIASSAIPKILEDSTKKKVSLKDYEQADESEIENTVKNIIKKNPSAPTGALMGMIMKELGGKADGKKVMELVKNHK